MFSRRSLATDLAEIRDIHAPDSVVLDVESDFETLPPAAAEDLGFFVDELSPVSYPDAWLPSDIPELLRRYAGPTFTIGLPGDGTVVRTTQTSPEAILVKRRAEGTPEEFLAFLIADRLVRSGTSPVSGALGSDRAPDRGVPETFLPFFGALYVDLDEAIRRPDRSDSDDSDAGDSDADGSDADGSAPDTEGGSKRPPTGSDPMDASTTGFDSTDVFQIAYALFEAWVGLHTREVFSTWERTHPRLYDAWLDAGDRLEGRLQELPSEIARGRTDFASATEYACSAVRHGLELPAPFTPLDTAAYRDRGAPYAVAWAEKTVSSMIEASE